MQIWDLADDLRRRIELQLLTQVQAALKRGTARSGASADGWVPESMVLQSLIHDDRDGFIAAEKAARRERCHLWICRW